MPDAPPATNATAAPTSPTGSVAGRALAWLARLLAMLRLSLALAAALLAPLLAQLPSGAELQAILDGSHIRFELAAGGNVRLADRIIGHPVALAQLPDFVPQAFIAIEDKRFRRHFGIDPRAVLRSMWRNLNAGHIVEGGSTVTQQVVKNLLLDASTTFRRKLLEAMLAIRLELLLTKDEILELYLNRIYFGRGAYGIHAAAQLYFDHGPEDLTPYQAAMLAGLVKAPSLLSPSIHPEAAAARARVVLAAMMEQGYISPSTYDAALREAGRAVAGVTPTGAPGSRHFIDHFGPGIRREAARLLADDQGIVAEGLRAVLTLAPSLQTEAERIVRRYVAESRARGVTQAALVAMRPDGTVVAMVGGVDYRSSQINYATTRMQPASTFKLFVYLCALERDFRPDDMISGAPLTVDGWKPRNADGKYRDRLPVREAFARSDNVAAVRLMLRGGGPDCVREMARRLGIRHPVPRVSSLPLGTAEVSLLEMTAAYAAIAAGGRYVHPRGLALLRTGTGRTVHRFPTEGERVLDVCTTARMEHLLRAAVVGAGHTGGKAAFGDHPVAGKTGTNDGFRGAWFIGYTADLVVGVWVGRHDGGGTDHVLGGGTPALIFRNFMANVLEGVAPQPLPNDGTCPADGGR